MSNTSAGVCYDTRNDSLCTSKVLFDMVYVRCITKNCKGEEDPNHILYFYPISHASHYKNTIQKNFSTETLEIICIRAIGMYISKLFNWLYFIMNFQDPALSRELLSIVIKHLQMITKSIPPLIANKFTSVTLKTLHTSTPFLKEVLHVDVHKKFLTVVLHPSVTSLHLPTSPIELELHISNKLVASTLNKVEVLCLEYCFSTVLQKIAYLPKLHTIILRNYCTDYVMEVLWHYCEHKLRKLDVANSRALTAESIRFLLMFPHLEELNISCTSIEGNKFQRLAYGMAGAKLPPTLQKISCGGISVTDLNVLAEVDLPNLSELCVERLLCCQPISLNIGNLRKLEITFSSLANGLLSIAGSLLTELHLIHVVNLDARILVRECPNLYRLEVKMCLHKITDYEETSLKGPIKNEFRFLEHLHLDTYYLLADTIFVRYGKNVKYLTVIAEKIEEAPINAFVEVLTAVPENLHNISFRSYLHDGLLSTDVVHKLIHLCPSLEVVEGVGSYEEANRLHRMNRSIQFIA